MDSTKQQPSLLTEEAFYKYMDAMKQSFQDSVNEKVETAVGPIRSKQSEIVTALNATSSKVTTLDSDHQVTKNKVLNLEYEVSNLRKELYTQASAASRPHPPDLTVNYDLQQKSRHSEVVSRVPSTEIQTIINNSRKILGFSPINLEDVNEMMAANNISLSEAMVRCIKDYMDLEMKIPLETINKQVIIRTFPPARQPDGWNFLYAEFECPSSSSLVQQYARHLQPGKQVSLYVPQCLQPRFSAVNSLAHKYRTGETKHKTRVKYGIDDFTLLVKPRSGNNPWVHASLASLPPFQLAPPSSTSPPKGRQRRHLRKRQRSSDDEARSTRPKNQAEKSVIQVNAANQIQETLTLESEEDSSSSALNLVMEPPSSNVTVSLPTPPSLEAVMSLNH